MPIQFSTSVTPDLGPIIARTRTLRDVLKRNTLSALRKQVRTLTTELAAATPRGRDAPEGGRKRLADSWVVTESGLEFVVSNTLTASNGVPVLRYVLHGNDPGGGWIYPTNARALSFVIGSEGIIRRRVRAYAGHDFVEPIVSRWIPTAEGVIGTAVRVTGTWLLTGSGGTIP